MFSLCLLTQAGSGGAAFTIATTPSSSTSAKIPYAPNFSAGPTGLDPYRPWRVAVIDGETFVVNGWDTPRRWDRAQSDWMYMGSAAPTTFGLALSAAGSPAAIPDGQTARYYLVGYNSTLDKETAPQGGGEVTIANGTGGTRDVTVTWTASEFPADFDKVRIYRALYQTDDFKRVNGAGTAVGAGTYLDISPDATLRALGLTYTWDGTTHTSLPGAFEGICESQGRLLLWGRAFGDQLWYTRGARTVGTYIADDLNETPIIIGADDSTGAPTAVISYHRSNIIFKRKAIYEMAGSDPATWDLRLLTTARGTFNPRTVIGVDRWFICLDDQGIYKLTPGLYAGVLGSVEEMFRAPMQPIIDRINVGAANLFHATHLPQQGQVVFWIALDFDPVPGHGLVFDYGSGRFVTLITRRNPTASGVLFDTLNVRHAIFTDDMGYVWEDLYGDSEGVFANDNTAAVSSSSDRTLTCGAATFATTAVGTSAGGLGAPLDRYNSAGTLVDENRVYAISATELVTYLYPTTAFATGDSVAIGVIPSVFETAALSFGTHEAKKVRDVYFEFASGTNGSLRMDMKLDDAAWRRKGEQSMLTASRETMPVANTTDLQVGHCFLFQVRVSKRYANVPFSIRALHIHYDPQPGVRRSL